MLHRDIKPSNLLIDADGNVWVTDFGLAKTEGTEDLTETGDFVGTLRYMAPERLEGVLDRRSDLYSLGVILYEMLAGEKPYTADNPMAIIYKHRKDPVPRLPVARAMLQPLVDGLMAKRPADRFPTASAAIVALEAAAARL